MRGRRNTWILITLLLAGALAGGLMGEFMSKYPYFEWMSFGGVNGYRELVAISLNPLIDAGVLKLGIDFALRINAGSIIGMIIGVLVFSRI